MIKLLVPLRLFQHLPFWMLWTLKSRYLKKISEASWKCSLVNTNAQRSKSISLSGRAVKTGSIKLLKPGHTVRAAQLYLVVSKTTHCTIFLFERLRILLDIQCSAEVLTLSRHQQCFITHRSYFDRSSFTFLTMQCPRLRQRLFHRTFSKTQASKSFLFQLVLFRSQVAIIQ